MAHNLDAALTYAARGWRVIPVPPGRKRPRPTGWQHAATTDPDTIRAWWTSHPDDGVGVATGPGSGLFVLDVDTGGGKTGHETLAALEARHGPLPATFTVATGSGGRHHYFATPPGADIRNGTAGPNLDIRGDGGFVVAPPSVHPNGTPYRVAADLEPAEPPAWLLERATRPPEAPAAAPAPTRTLAPAAPAAGDPDDGPAGAYNRATTWHDLLTGDGWTPGPTTGTETRWTRPGKDPRDGIGATTGHAGRDVLKVFTSSVPELDAGRAYSRFGYYAATRHNGDRSEAARELRRLGYGTSPDSPDPLAWIERPADPPLPPPAHVDPHTGEVLDDGAWPDPIPLGNAARTLPGFPLDTLPAWITDHVRAVADDLQVPVDLPATVALACLAMTTAGHVTVAAGGWTTATNLYLVVAMPPGAGKSPVFAAMTRALEDYEAELAAALAPAIAEAETRRRVAEKAAHNAEQKGDATEAYQRHLEALAIDVPVAPRLIADDATPEAMVALLAQQGGRLALLSTEGGLFDLMTGRYSTTANLDPYLQAWSGDTIRVDRIGREGAHVRNPTLTIGLTVQPAVLAALAERPELAGRGLTARFMYALPPDNVGRRDFTRTGRHDPTARAAYERHLVGLYATMRAYQTPGTLTLDGDALARFTAWRQTIENRRTPTGDLRPLAEWTTKLEASVLRLAGILHVAHGGPHHGDVNAATVEQAIAVGDYWTAHAFAVHDLWGTDDTLRNARRILEWAAGTDRRRFTIRDVYAGNRRTFPRAADTLEPLRLLAERGWVRPLSDGPINVGKRGSPSPEFAINPNAHPDRPPAVAPAPAWHPAGDSPTVGEGRAHGAQLDTEALEGEDPGARMARNFDPEPPASCAPCARPETGETHTGTQADTSRPVELRAMRAMRVKANSGSLTNTENPRPPEAPHHDPSAHGAHGAQLPDQPHWTDLF